MIFIILQHMLRFSETEYVANSSVVFVLLFLPLAIVIREEFNLWKTKTQSLQDVIVQLANPQPTAEEPIKLHKRIMNKMF